MALGTNLKFCTSVAKGLKLKVRKFCGPTPTFVEVTGEKMVGGGPFCPLLPPSWIGLRLCRFGQNLLTNVLHNFLIEFVQKSVVATVQKFELRIALPYLGNFF